VIVLRVVLEDLLLLRVLPSWDGVVEVGLLPPLLAVDEHLLGELDIELAGAEETELKYHGVYVSKHFVLTATFSIAEKSYQCQSVKALGESLGLEKQTKLGNLSLLSLRQEAGVSRLGNGSGGGIVVIIVLGVELQRCGCGCGSSHCISSVRV